MVTATGVGFKAGLFPNAIITETIERSLGLYFLCDAKIPKTKLSSLKFPLSKLKSLGKIFLIDPQ